MIKGRYVAQIEIDFSYHSNPSKSEFEFSYDKLHSDWMEKAIKYHLNEIFYGGNTQIKVTKQLADIYKVGDEDASD